MNAFLELWRVAGGFLGLADARSLAAVARCACALPPAGGAGGAGLGNVAGDCGHRRS